VARLGCLIALVGLFLAATSVFLFGAAVSRLLRPGTAVMVPLALADQPLPLAGGERLRLWCRLELDSASVNSDGSAWHARYTLPLSWDVTDGASALAHGTAGLGWDDRDRRVIEEQANQSGGSVVVEHPLARMSLPDRATARATASLGEDIAWHAHVRRAWLVVREDDTESGAFALGAVAMLVLGPMLAAAGVGMAVLSWVRAWDAKREKRAARSEQPEASSQEPTAGSGQ
jgi:hypothetical protein